MPGGLDPLQYRRLRDLLRPDRLEPRNRAAIGKMGIPEMMRRGYPSTVATGSIAAGGTLGILIPPSVTMIVYGISTETSIGRLFLAGVVPGIMLTAMFMAGRSSTPSGAVSVSTILGSGSPLRTDPHFRRRYAVRLHYRRGDVCALWWRGDTFRSGGRGGSSHPHRGRSSSTG